MVSDGFSFFFWFWTPSGLGFLNRVIITMTIWFKSIDIKQILIEYPL